MTRQKQLPPPHQLSDWLHQRLVQRNHSKPVPHNEHWPQQFSRAPLHVHAPMDLVFTRQEVVQRATGPVIDRLMGLTDTKAACAQNFGKFRLVFDGYSHTNAQISELHEVRRFFLRISAQWPYWLHFLAPNAENAATILNLTFDAVTVNMSERTVKSQIAITDIGTERFSNLAHATLTLHDAMDVPHRMTRRLANDLRHALCTVLK